MASNTQTLFGMLKMLREAKNAQEKCIALTYIRSNTSILELTDVLKEEDKNSEICNLIIDAFTSDDQIVHHEAYITLNVILCTFKNHCLNLFQTLFHVNRKNRVKVFQFLEVTEDSAVIAAARDIKTVDFLSDCMQSIQPDTMEWLATASSKDALQLLAEAENRSLTDDQRLEEQLINFSLTFLQRLYKISLTACDFQIERFDTLIMDKVTTLAYMGHKRQRSLAIKLFQQVVANNLGSRIRASSPNAWSQYKSTLQSLYCGRMFLLVETCDPDWVVQWTTSIQLLGTDLHRGAGLINNLLSVEEKAFKSTDTVIRRQAFLSWKLLIDNFALDPQELATPRRVKLLCIPLNAKNSKTESMALTKLEVWWHLIIKLYKDISKFVNPVITQFLNFCFGPLGDTPLLSFKVDVAASPGKRFIKTNVVAIDALIELIITKKEDYNVVKPVLKERLPCAVSDAIFLEGYKSFVHSVGEALLILNQLYDEDIANRQQLGRILWTNLIHRVQSISSESKKIQVYKDVMLVIEELGNHAQNKLLIRNLFLDVILLGLVEIPGRLIHRDISLIDFVSKFTTAAVLYDVNKSHYDAIKYLLWEGIKPPIMMTFLPNTLQSLNSILNKIISTKSDSCNETVISELWCIIAEVTTKYIKDDQEFNEGNAAEHKFETVKSIMSFPFIHVFLKDSMQVKKVANVWKDLYKQFDLKADLITTVKPNEIVTDTTIMIQDCLGKDKRCCSLAVHCLDALLNAINYKYLLVQDEVSSVVRLISDLSTITLSKAENHEAKCALKALSAMLITVYGHDPQKVVLYLEVVKPAIELMLTPQTEDNLIKEIANTWETLVSIFKGLNNMLTVDLLSSYREAIALAIHHSNSEIESQALSILKIQDNLEENAKVLLEELANEIKKSPSKRKHIVKGKEDKSERSGKHVRLVGSFLNRKSVSPKPVISKSKEKEETKIPPESDSQEYVLIKSDFKLDAKRLTEHQKESLKRRRDDIPAMYNDLSQSSSQDTQNLQMWFDRKLNQVNKISKEQMSSTDDSETETIIDYDANKENNVSSGLLRTGNNDKLTVAKSDTTSVEVEDQNVTSDSVCNDDDNQDKDTAIDAPNIAEVDLNKNKTEAEKEDLTKENVVANVSAIPLHDESFDIDSEKPENDSQVDPSIAKKLDFECREEFPDDKESDQSASPSVIEGSKRRGRKPGPKSFTYASKSEDSNTLQEKQCSSQILQKSSRGRGRPKDSSRQVAFDDNKKNVKRKAASDSETEGSVSRRQRRKTILPPSEVPSDTDSIKSTESEQSSTSTNAEVPVGQEGLSQRTKHEIARLRINMVFDGPLPSRRRSKVLEETANVELRGKRQATLEGSGIKLRSGDIKSGESSKKTPKIVEREIKIEDQDQSKRRTRRSARHDAKDIEPMEVIEMSDNSNSDSSIVTKKTMSEEQKSKVKKQVKDKSESLETMVITKAEILEENVNDSLVPVVAHEEEVESEIPEDMENAIEDDSALDALCPNNSAVDNLEQIEQPELIDDSNNAESHTIEEEKSQDQDNSEDIVESSQDSSISSVLEKKCSDRKCFIKINKIQNLRLSFVESTTVKTDMVELAKDSTDMSEVLKESNKDILERDDVTDHEHVETSVEENSDKLKIVENVEPEDVKMSCSETQKPHEPSSLTKPSLDVSSPKSNTKRLCKLKIFPPQGRGAHMLDLVTKQALTESDGQNVRTDDDLATCKKSKSKDADSDAKKDKVAVLKECDKMESPSGSRQEKIFNNMKSIDYCTSSLPKLFGNLKNDGEKISLKVDKITPESIPVETDNSKEKENSDNVSPLTEKEDLPILEWSNTNPPSLTASPSASILKRHHQILQDTDPETMTPSKRKRVSFADPPVSKEMGYEIALAGSPHRINKLSVTRALPARKEPIKLKQAKLKIIHTNSEKAEKDNESQGERANEVDSQCEKENEMLTKIADDLESESMEMDVEAEFVCDTNETVSQSNDSTVTTVDNSTADVETTSNVNTQETVVVKEEMIIIKEEEKDVEQRVPEEENHTSEKVENVVTDNTETQDIFSNNINIYGDGHEVLINEFVEKTNYEPDTFVPNSNVDPLKLNVANDSIMDAIENLPKEECKSEILEDTVDVQNLTGLNSTTNSDETFCSKPIRSSTQFSNNTEEMDTLPVTDSLFASLPLSQESSQSSTQNTAELTQLESLDSTLPICPALVVCHEPIGSLIGNLANPLWVSQLSNYFSNRGLQTVGDLAQLSEREVNRIPVRSSSKVDFVRNVLQQFESSRLSSPQASTAVPKETKTVTPDQLICSTPTGTPRINISTTSQSAKKTPRKTLCEPSVSMFANSPALKTYSASQYKKIAPARTPAEILGPVSIGSSQSDASVMPQHRQISLAESVCSGSAQLNVPSTSQYVQIVHTSPFASQTVTATPAESSLYRYVQIAPKNSSESIQSTSVGPIFINTVATDVVYPTVIGTSAPTHNANVTFARAPTAPVSMVSTSTSTDPPPKKATRSVSAQMALEDLLDEIDVNLVLQSAVRRATPDHILTQYKIKMKHMPEAELERETLRMLGINSKGNPYDVTLKAICRACGVNRVLIRLPDIFSTDKQFFIKVLNAYRKKLKVSDCLSGLDFTEVKDAVCQKCSSSELAEMLSKTLKEEENNGITKPMTELSSLNAMLKRMPMDLIISHTVANEEVIPAPLVLDIALQNNSPSAIVRTLQSHSSANTRSVFNQLCTIDTLVSYIREHDLSEENLLEIYKVVSAKLNPITVLNAFHVTMLSKLPSDVEEISFT